jgi:hypothetical protein
MNFGFESKFFIFQKKIIKWNENVAPPRVTLVVENKALAHGHK